MLQLIVNADDFGLSEGVNEGIVEAHLNGIVTSTSIMANGAAFDHAIRLCESCPSLDLGIHLTLVEETPLLNAEAIPSLVDAGGRFHRHASAFMKKYLAGVIRPRDVEAELETQIQKVKSRGIRISHLDSHQHLHVLPQIWRIAVELAKKYNIPAIRLPYERLRPYMMKEASEFLRVAHLLALNAFCLLDKKPVLRRTDHFAGFFFGGKLNKENLRTLLDCLPQAGTCEIMCHPGNGDQAGGYPHWGYRWSQELSALTDPEILESLRQKGVRLISYRQLASELREPTTESAKAVSSQR